MLEPVLNFPLIATRALHFASTVTVAGVFLFLHFVAEPAFGKDASGALERAAHRARLVGIAWCGLALSVASAGAWLLHLSADISRSSPARALFDGTVQTVLTRTQFGHDWQVRLGLAVVLSVVILGFGREARTSSRARDLLAAVLAACLLGALAWAGHAGASPGLKGHVQIAADALHLVAAGAWIGGLTPLALLLLSAHRASSPAWMTVAREATVRFSTLGVAAVGTLIVTGIVNTWALVSSLSGLLETLYGRVLLLKIGLFLSMLAVAVVNRYRLTPRLKLPAASAAIPDALRQLERNCVIEVILGFMVLLAVSALGSIAPPMHGMHETQRIGEVQGLAEAQAMQRMQALRMHH